MWRCHEKRIKRIVPLALPLALDRTYLAKYRIIG
jgi:hypothetical protein